VQYKKKYQFRIIPVNSFPVALNPGLLFIKMHLPPFGCLIIDFFNFSKIMIQTTALKWATKINKGKPANSIYQIVI
jgi:hypothetical protein